MGKCCWPASSGGSVGVSAFWHSVFIPADLFNLGQAVARQEIVYGVGAGNQQEYNVDSYDQNEESDQHSSTDWALPFNWKIASLIKFNIYWFVYNEGSHNVEHKWQVRIRSIGNGEALSFNGVWNNNYDTESANDLLFISPVVTITPASVGGLSPLDLLHIAVGRQNDSASGSAKLRGIQLHWEIDPSIVVP